ncbi:MAG: WYL domain-containing protein, partial [Erysipelotrichaceae bacterium]|nr:WYL domain-containing protein [Erysipelotrichaceae bacterium]
NAYYLLGFSHKRNDYRIYRFSELRMLDCQETQTKFLRDSWFHIEQHIGKNSLIKGKFVRVFVRVDPAYEDVFKEVQWGLDFRQEQQGDYSFLIEDKYSFIRNVFSLHEHIQILQPAEMRAYYIDVLQKTLKQYQ